MWCKLAEMISNYFVGLCIIIGVQIWKLKINFVCDMLIIIKYSIECMGEYSALFSFEIV